MSPAPGWFPDPDGTPGRFRYWDGAAWTAQTSAQPGPPDPARTPARSARSGRIALIVALVVVVLAAGTWLVVRAVGRDGTEITEPPPISTVSPGDDGEDTPSPSAGPTRATGSVTPDPSGTRPERCDETRPNELPAPRDTTRVHGGPLSYPTAALPGWTGPTAEPRIPYGRDAWMLYQVVPTETRGWQSSAVVGVTTFTDDPSTSDAANTILQCVITSSLYQAMSVKISTSSSKKVTVDGVAASRVDAVISFDDPGLNTKGSRLWILVVDTQPATFFFAAVPKESTDLVAPIEKVISGLTVD